MKQLHQILDTMRLPNGAYLASPSSDYSYVWIRDVAYAVLPYLSTECDRFQKAYHALFDLFRKYEWKIDIHTVQKPVQFFEYIHSRYSPELNELAEPWGHAQNDAIGAFLFGVGEGIRRGRLYFRDEVDKRIVQKLVQYLDCLQYWQEPDHGMWEENVEVHASSVGACVAGLKAVQLLVDVPPELIRAGEQTLSELLPRESVSKETDLALLSLIYPYQVVPRHMALQILERVTSQLQCTYGCIRYQGDRYYNEGSEAEWCFGFPWLGLCYAMLGEKEQAVTYYEKTLAIVPPNGEVPELYIGGTSRPNGNRPLAWAVAMVILLAEQIGQHQPYEKDLGDSSCKQVV